jgi:hypothetical protein
MQLVSPVTGAPLAPDADGHLVAPGERWPVVDGIPYLRTGREELIARVFALIDGGHGMQALLALLADSDDWWTAPPPSDADLQAAVHARTLRLAMDRLGYGPVGDYFAFRWSDPTFLSGLGLLDRHAGGAHSAFELACGIGHLLRELQLRGARVAGGDVVFSKLWLARRFVVPSAELVCFDAGAGLPGARRLRRRAVPRRPALRPRPGARRARARPARADRARRARPQRRRGEPLPRRAAPGRRLRRAARRRGAVRRRRARGLAVRRRRRAPAACGRARRPARDRPSPAAGRPPTAPTACRGPAPACGSTRCSTAGASAGRPSGTSASTRP